MHEMIIEYEGESFVELEEVSHSLYENAKKKDSKTKMTNVRKVIM